MIWGVVVRLRSDMHPREEAEPLAKAIRGVQNRKLRTVAEASKSTPAER